MSPLDAERAEVAIVGAGIVGLATALRLLERVPDLRMVLLEKEATIASHQTGHNSGVLHAGLYYTPGSLKARLCREGNAELRLFRIVIVVAHAAKKTGRRAGSQNGCCLADDCLPDAHVKHLNHRCPAAAKCEMRR